MRPIHLTHLLLLVVVPACALTAAEPDDDHPHRRQRRALLQKRARELTFEFEDGGQKLSLGESPILRWANPVREFVNDGATWLLLPSADDKGRGDPNYRPQAVASVWVRSREAALQRGDVLLELVSLSASSLVCRQGERVLWSPERGSLVDQPLPEAPPPQAKPAQRLAQMRSLARRFAASLHKGETPSELRLLPQPLYRYPDRSRDALDGALFAFVEANDAEVLLLLEATADKEPTWRYTLSRMTSFKTTVQLDGKEVSSTLPYWHHPRKSSDPYLEMELGKFELE